MFVYLVIEFVIWVIEVVIPRETTENNKIHNENTSNHNKLDYKTQDKSQDKHKQDKTNYNTKNTTRKGDL